MIVLIMGLPGSGKSTLSGELVKTFSSLGKTVQWLNADTVRSRSNDWDFSDDGRLRQANRLKSAINNNADVVIVDFVAAMSQQRDIIKADLLVWMNTISESRFDDTNKRFEKPDNADLTLTQLDSVTNVDLVVSLCD